jgi:hypothetical protein
LSEIEPLSNRKAADDIGMKIELAQRTEFVYVDSILTEIGDSLDSRSASIEFVEELQNIYEEYENLYERYPDSIEKIAQTTIYRMRGNMLIMEKGWSASAIYWYFKGVLIMPNNIETLFAFFLSFFGRPGIQTGMLAQNHLQRTDAEK